MGINTFRAPNADEQAIRSISLARMTGIVGLVALVLIYVPIVGLSGQEPSFGDDAAAVLPFFQATSSEAAQLGRAVLVVGLLAFTWFAIGLSLLLAEAEGRPAWRSTIAGASALLFVASGMNGPEQAAAYRADTLTPELASYAFSVGHLEFENGWVAMGSFALCVGLAIIRTRALPQWLGWLAVVSGLGMVASRAFWTTSIWLAPYALFWLAIIVISIRLLRSGAGRRQSVT